MKRKTYKDPAATKREIKFIESLGNGDNTEHDRLLFKYFLSALKRDDWGSIDAIFIYRFLAGELSRIGVVRSFIEKNEYLQIIFEPDHYPMVCNIKL